MSTHAPRSYIQDQVETLPQPELERLQVESLRSGIDRVSRTVPFYQAQLRKAGVTHQTVG